MEIDPTTAPRTGLSGSNQPRSANHHHNQDSTALKGWKKPIEENFRLWLQQLETRDDISEPADDGPDLYSFFEELCILRSEVRTNSRRSHEAFVHLGEALTEFERMMQTLKIEMADERQIRKAEDVASKKEFFLPFVELLSRFNRIQDKLSRLPGGGLFTARRRWNAAWSALQEGVGILREHFEQLLKKEGITAMDTLGKPFDPSLMKAVDIVQTDEVESNTVIEEMGAGYLYKNRVLKFAEVKIAVNKGN